MAGQGGDGFQAHAAVETGREQCSNYVEYLSLELVESGIRQGW